MTVCLLDDCGFIPGMGWKASVYHSVLVASLRSKSFRRLLPPYLSDWCVKLTFPSGFRNGMHGALPPMSLLIILGCAWAGQRYRFIMRSVVYPTSSTLLPWHFFVILLHVIAVLNMRLPQLYALYIELNLLSGCIGSHFSTRDIKEKTYRC